MITKFTLTIGGIEHDLSRSGTADCIKNWADVVCAYKRSDYGGVVRSFTSKFQFVGIAYELLLDEWRRRGYDAQATLGVHTIEDDRSWTKQFECELDFSTKSIADGVFSVGAVDNSLAAIIKASKSTKYEMLVGEELPACGLFRFDRLPMTESATYALTQGESDEQSGALAVDYEPPTDGSRAIWMGNIADEISVGRTILWKDDQENNENGFLIEAYKPCSVSVASDIRIDRRGNGLQGMELTLVHMGADNAEKSRRVLARMGGAAPTSVGSYATEAALNAAHPQDGYTAADNGKYYAIVGEEETCYILTYIGYACAWINSGKTADQALVETTELAFSVQMEQGDRLKAIGGEYASRFKVAYSSLKFSWTAIGDACDIEAISPETLANALLARMAEGKLNPVATISGRDPRLAKTILMAAESARAMPSAKAYSSFGEFCDWMSAVFGYVYTIGERRPSALTMPKRAAGYVETAARSYSNTLYSGAVNTERIVYMEAYGKFMYRAENTSQLYSQWSGWQNYNHQGHGRARSDTPFVIGGVCYYFTYSNSTVIRHQYAGNPDYAYLDFQDVSFVHRAELFPAVARVKVIADAKDVSNATASAQIYSAVDVGYDKKDYDQINGRDEFNFESTYETGCSVSERRLTLKSKYRADCYGLEFAAQKRGKETTDSESDNDMFFAYCDRPRAGSYKPNRTDYPIQGALTDKVFNGAYCPRQCVLANEGYIGMQADRLTLKFASSKGNSSVSIGGVPMTADIVLDNPLMMAETLEFSTDDETLPTRMSDLVLVEDRGIEYLGYVSEIEMKFAKETAIKYKLLIKTIEI